MEGGLIQKRREEVIELLTQAFSRDLIDTHEYELRVGKANELDDLRSLNSLVSDLNDYSSPKGNSLVTYPAQGTQLVRSILGSQKLDGDWLAKDYVRLQAVLGSVSCDFRRPVLGPETRVDVFAFMGEVKIIVPRAMNLQIEVSPILGEVKRRTPDESRIYRHVKGLINSFLGSETENLPMNQNSHPAARLIISGTCIMSSLTIIEKD